ncbi:Lrp/AsnC ligand binding domain-containing protein [Streptomyces sp. NPDC059849]|uniref:Lrp/AsnC ligand binding domain-containing protein n=1 Tax=Streptomyces sp. NPDC059849 TaxID=3346969 RepID=UPI0036505A5A
MSSSSRCNTLLDARRRPGYGGTPLDQAERQRHGLGHGPRGAGHGAPESCLAVIQRSRAPSQALAVAHRTARLPNVLSIEHTNGPGALTMLVEVRDFAFLSRFLLESPGSIPGVDNASGHAVAKVVAIGDHWQPSHSFWTVGSALVADISGTRWVGWNGPDTPSAELGKLQMIRS